MVGAEQVILGWPFQNAREVLFCIVVWGEQRAEKDEQKEGHHDDKAQRAQRLLENLAQHGHTIQHALPAVGPTRHEFHLNLAFLSV